MSQTESDVNKVFRDIQTAGFDINCVGTLNGYLGIEVQQQRNGNIHLKQPTLVSVSVNGQKPNKIQRRLEQPLTEERQNQHTMQPGTTDRSLAN